MGHDQPYPITPLRDLDMGRLRTYSLRDRGGKVGLDHLASPQPGRGTMAHWLHSLPDTLAAADLMSAARAVVSAREAGKGVLLGMGAHPVKVGLGPLIAGAVDEGIFTGIATNGAAIIHDYELALTGQTSEDVDAVLSEGRFGMAEETAVDLNGAISDGARSGMGIGRAVGRLIAESGAPHSGVSVFAAAYRRPVPATVHVALGTDVIHMHASCDGAAVGQASLLDFHLLARQVAALDGGVFINLGSAVIIPEVFLKACSVAINLGWGLEGLTTVNMDFIQHYRPRVNVLARPPGSTGRGISLTGHHELMLPLLLAAVRELR
ncbi:MAG: hypothetical protein JSV00_09370 [bacterium]|nr:MAG: hypothetical protein JSV00_09370 [bacterium]